MNKPYAESCDQNREPILAVIQPLLQDSRAVLEIGSGTGQHAVYFAEKMPHLTWYTSDCEAYLPGIRLWLEQANLPNTPTPELLDVSSSNWPRQQIDAVFSANTVHIMHWPNVVDFFYGVGKSLPGGGKLLLYGPFNDDNEYTSESNERFDDWLKSRDPDSGIRNFQDLDLLARQAGMELVRDYAMPANNRILFWQKQLEKSTI